MILANITILPLWATCALWSAIAPTPICAAFRSPPSLTARCSKALCRGSAERACAGRQRKPTVRFAAAGRTFVTRSFRKHISLGAAKMRNAAAGCVCSAAPARVQHCGDRRAVQAGPAACAPNAQKSVFRLSAVPWGREGGEKMKDQHTRMLHGRLLRPLKVGSSALIDHEGQFILTSLVTSIQVQNEQEAKFETLNTHYHVKFSPLQAAVAASILMAVAA